MTPCALIQLEQRRHPGQMPEAVSDGFVIAYFFDGVRIGRWIGGEAQFAAECDWLNLMELHLFNANEEFRALYSRDYALPGAENETHWLTRYIRDGADLPAHKDEKMLLIGNGPDKTATPEERAIGFAARGEAGRRITLPTEACGKRLWVRNYLCFDLIDSQNADLPPLEAMRISDYRFVGFADFAENTQTGGK